MFVRMCSLKIQTLNSLMSHQRVEWNETLMSETEMDSFRPAGHSSVLV